MWLFVCFGFACGFGWFFVCFVVCFVCVFCSFFSSTFEVFFPSVAADFALRLGPKEDKDNAKKAAKQAAKVENNEKNYLKRRTRLLKARHGSFRSGGLLSPNVPPNNGPLHTPQVTSVVLRRAAKGLSREDIQLLLTAKEADNTGD